ncbi:hypothetical protein J1N35_001236, partial [Gossypium stocksii]
KVAQLKDRHWAYVGAIKGEMRENLKKKNVKIKSLQALVDSIKRDKDIEVTLAKEEMDRSISEAKATTRAKVSSTFNGLSMVLFWVFKWLMAHLISLMSCKENYVMQ